MFTRTASIVTIICIVTATTIPSFKPTAADESNYPGPVIFVPGDGGSQLEARLHKPDHVHYWCWLNSDWFDIWLNIRLLTPAEFDCFSDNMRLFYNATTRTTQNNQGVEIRSTNYGSLDSVTYLNTAKIYQTDYFENIAAALEKVHKLKRNDDMVGAPYDFRKAPNELEEFFQNLTRQIEHQYVIHNSEPVTLICHSMGCLNTLYLLNRQSQNWKDVLIRRVIALAAPWHGSFKAIKTMLFGDDLGIPVIFKYRQGVLQDLQKTFPSLMYLFPRAPSFDENQTIVQTLAANYTLKNLDKLFEAANLLDQREMWHDVRSIAANLKAPNVELWCLYGNIPNSTPAWLEIDKPFDDFRFDEILGAGDGTVNLDSLRACEYFAQQQSKPVYTREFENFDHVDVLKKKEVADFITSQIFNSSMAWNRIK